MYNSVLVAHLFIHLFRIVDIEVIGVKVGIIIIIMYSCFSRSEIRFLLTGTIYRYNLI